MQSQSFDLRSTRKLLSSNDFHYNFANKFQIVSESFYQVSSGKNNSVYLKKGSEVCTVYRQGSKDHDYKPVTAQ